jgi:hypothetical protein
MAPTRSEEASYILLFRNVRSNRHADVAHGPRVSIEPLPVDCGCPNAFASSPVGKATRALPLSRSVLLRVRLPVASGISKWVYRHIAQEVCPFNVKFAQALAVPELAPREVLRDRAPRELARDILAMTQEECSAAFKGSPMKRAKLRGLKRNAAVVLGSIGDARDVDALTRALDDRESLVREHARWALEQVATPESRDARHAEERL